jgi:non-ribosomal peptide synthetase component F
MCGIAGYLDLRGERPPEEPLSFSQMRLWFLDQLEPGQPVYNISVGVRLEGRLEILRLAWSLRRIVQRHRVLRSSFHNQQGQAVVRVNQTASVPLGVVDLTALPRPARQAVSHAVQSAEAGRGFDLSLGPLLRCRLLRLSAEEHRGVFTMHHIISDAWSMGVLIRELSILYAAGPQGAASALPNPELQYGDFVAWQRHWLQGPALEAQLEYWKQQLAGAALLLELPTDSSRPAQPGYAGSVAWWNVDAALYRRLTALAQSEGVTLFMVLLAVWQVLLWRCSGQTDWLIGTPIANRTRQELEGMLGLFANTLVLRARVRGEWSFRQLLQQVRETALGAYAHQDLPFERLVEELQPERRLNRQPLFQVAFTMQNVPAAALELPGLRLTAMEDEPQTSKFDLNLTVITAADSGIRGLLEYSTELFARSTMERMLGHWCQLLEAVAADPGQTLWELPLLTPPEREQIVHEWNATGEVQAPEGCIHELFEEQVRRNGERIALVCGDQQLSYSELNRRANQLAHSLRELGVRPESRVGICLRRSPDIVVALLAILKAGAAYVPLDPAYPPARLRFVLEDAQVAAFVSSSDFIRNLGDIRTSVIALDESRDVLAGRPGEDFHSGATARNAAYVIYTSGSTGQPKGVAIEHGSAVAFLSWAAAAFAPQMRASVLAATSICFDLSIFEIFGPLSNGGTIALVDSALAVDSITPEQDVVLINTVPSAMAELVRTGTLPATVRTINLAGEPLQRGLVEQIYERYPGTPSAISTGRQSTPPIRHGP